MKNFWKDKKVLVTGGTGFIGSFVVEQLLERGARVTATTVSGNLKNVEHIKNDIEIIKVDLTNSNNANKISKGKDIILNLASRVAGIQFIVSHPATMFTDTVVITKNMIEAARKNNVERFLITSSACVYPRNCSIPTPEVEGFKDDPEPANLGYGWGKRVSELLGRFYAQEFGMKIAIARPYNVYGPRDNFDIATSTVVPGLIRRIFDGEDPLLVWGSGKQTRSFLYVRDCARGLIEVTEKYAVADPVNLGSDEEVSIASLAKLIVKLSGKNPQIKFDTTKPDGQPRRKCDTKKAKEKFGFEPQVFLEDGISQTIKWFKQSFNK